MSSFLHFSEHTLQEVALGFMTLVYTVRIVWFLQFKAGSERQGQSGAAETTPTKGILYSWANIAMPWGMESTRKKFLLYLQFVIFHLGVAAAILLSFVIPYAPSLLGIGAIVLAFRLIMGAACAVALQNPGFPAWGLPVVAVDDELFEPSGSGVQGSAPRHRAILRRRPSPGSGGQSCPQPLSCSAPNSPGRSREPTRHRPDC